MVRCGALQRNYPSSWGMRHRGNNKCGFTTAKKLVGTRRMGVGASASRGFQWIAPEIVCLGRRWCQARQSQQERHLTTTLADLPWRSPWLASRWSPLVHNHWVDPEFHRSVQIMCLRRPVTLFAGKAQTAEIHYPRARVIARFKRNMRDLRLPAQSPFFVDGIQHWPSLVGSPAHSSKMSWSTATT